jgi:hypothetical protein
VSAKPSLGPPKPAAPAGAAGVAGAAATKNDADKADDADKPKVPDAKPDPAVPAAATAAAAAKGAEVDSDADESREREPAIAGAAAGSAPTALREREGGGGPPVPGRADTDGSPDRPGPPRSARPSSPNLGKAVSSPRSAAALRSGRPSATVPPRGGSTARSENGEGHNRRPLIFIAAGVVILVLGIIIAVTQFGGGDDAKKTANTIEGVPSKTQTDDGGNSSTTPKTKPKAAPVNRGEITVAVLNGTTAPGLAATVGDQLEGEGFQRGLVANAADQQQPATTVYYGPSQKRAAQEVAKILKTAAVKPLDAGTQAIAGADASVVVIVGNDRTS